MTLKAVQESKGGRKGPLLRFETTHAKEQTTMGDTIRVARYAEKGKGVLALL